MNGKMGLEMRGRSKRISGIWGGVWVLAAWTAACAAEPWQAQLINAQAGISPKQKYDDAFNRAIVLEFVDRVAPEEVPALFASVLKPDAVLLRSLMAEELIKRWIYEPPASGYESFAGYLEDAQRDVRLIGVKLVGVGQVQKTAPRLMALMQEGDEDIASKAAWALGALPYPPAAPLMMSLLISRPGGLHGELTKALGQLGREALPDLLKAAAHPKAVVRSMVVQIFRQGMASGWLASEDQAIDGLVRLLDDEVDGVAAQAGSVLGNLRGERVFSRCVLALQNGSLRQRSQVIPVLGRFGPAGLSLVADVQRHGEPMLRERALWVLTQSAREASPWLVEALAHPDAKVREAAASALGGYEQPREWLPQPVGLGSRLIRPPARPLPAPFPEEPGVAEGLSKAVRDPDARVRTAAVKALINLLYPSAAPGLVEALLDRDPLNRMAAVKGLVLLQYRAAVPALQALLNDPDPQVRDTARTGLGHLGAMEPGSDFEERRQP